MGIENLDGQGGRPVEVDLKKTLLWKAGRNR